ncbi:hypothetical protein [uncultured Tateyamaria sp.]|uniref:hypothetical protein n=1 Tax=uncultured Tateyamaria sp. TaxID=455651 RepID=UPI0026342559|nr:hypothetical protein [uncultured Tateyamaria sp.]
MTSEPEPYDIIGVPAFQVGPLSEYSTGLMAADVQGIAHCGERDRCDQIFVRGVLEADLIAQFVDAAQKGRRMRVVGPAVWHLESIDMVIENVTAAD